MPIKIGTVSYLNAAPVNEGLDSRADVVLSRAVPSALAEQLAAGELDAGLIPVFEALRNPQYRIVPDVSISCRGFVQSVRLMCRKPVRELQTVALDPSSRTSAALTRVLLETLCDKLEYRVGIDPSADAQLLIGDPALNNIEEPHLDIDLGQLWLETTGLPFVFAVWAARPSAAAPELAQILQDAKRAGRERLDAVVERESKERNIPLSIVEYYLTRNIEYDLNHDHIAGLKWFAYLCAEIGLIEKAPDIDQMLIF